MSIRPGPRRTAFWGAGIVAVLAAALLAPPTAAVANTTPIPLPGSGIVPTVLAAGNADKSSDLTLFTSGPDAYFWVNDFNQSTSTLTWTVNATTGTTFDVTGILSAAAGTAFTVTDTANQSKVTYTTPTSGWMHQSLGSITVPAGTSKIVLSRAGSTSSETDVKSLELLPSASLTDYNSSVANARANGQWLTDGGYGIFLQYGAWGYPKSGSAKSLDAQACDFNVQNFVNMVQSTGASYVMWSYTWYTYQVDEPNTAIDSIYGDSSLTSSCDLDLEVAQALHAIGVKFLLYYHMGHDDPTWWGKQGYPSSTHAQTGTGDMSTFNTNWKSVIQWVGNHFGTNLDGWWFDDGSYYYPDDFAALETAARAGNPARLVSFNNWVAARFTDYQDYSSGETCSNGVGPGTVDSTGVYTSGPATGLRAHCMLMLNQDWGVHTANTTIAAPDVSRIVAAATNAKNNHTALSLNVMMWEDGTIEPNTYDALQAVNRVFHPAATMIDDASPRIAYSGAWGTSTGRSGGDYQGDVHYTTQNGATASITFTGTGIDLIGPSGPGYGTGTVSVDGVAQGSVTQDISSVYNAQQVLWSVRGLSAGTHTLRLTSTSSGGQAYLQLDAANVIESNVSMTNDPASSISYGGTWGYSANRSGGDFQGDVHYTTQNGATATVTFTGTGVDLLGPTSPGGGTGTVTIDGQSRGSMTEDSGTGYQPQQSVFSVRGLSSGTHTLVLTSTSAGGQAYVQLDAVRTVG